MKKYTIHYIDAIGNMYKKEIHAENKGQALNALYAFFMENGIAYDITKIESEGEDD